MTFAFSEHIAQTAAEMATERGFPSVEAYLEELVLQDEQQRFSFAIRNRKQLEIAIQQGLESGPAVPFTDGDWDELYRSIGSSASRRKAPSGAIA